MMVAALGWNTLIINHYGCNVGLFNLSLIWNSNILLIPKKLLYYLSLNVEQICLICSLKLLPILQLSASSVVYCIDAKLVVVLETFLLP